MKMLHDVWFVLLIVRGNLQSIGSELGLFLCCWCFFGKVSPFFLLAYVLSACFCCLVCTHTLSVMFWCLLYEYLPYKKNESHWVSVAYCMNIYPTKKMSLTGSQLGLYLETQATGTFRNPLPFFGENMIFMIPFCPKHSLVCLKSYLRVKSGCHHSFF